MNFFLTEENSTSTSGLQPNGHALKSNLALPIWRGNTLPQGTVGRNIGCFNPESREVAAILLVKIFVKETCVSHLRSLWFATRWHDSCTLVYRNLGFFFFWHTDDAYLNIKEQLHTDLVSVGHIMIRHIWACSSSSLCPLSYSLKWRLCFPSLVMIVEFLIDNISRQGEL